MDVIALTIEEVLPIRHKVLWPDKPISFCRVEEDDQGEHFGVKVAGNVVCVASVFQHANEARLRKFATLPEYQGRGIGSLVIKFLIQYYCRKGASLFWFDARESAIPFYEKFGFTAEGQRFYKSEQAYFKMAKSLP